MSEWMSPVGLERSTERKMIKELKEFFEKGFHRLTLSDRENKILAFLSEKETWTDLKIKRYSDKEFDILIEGERGIEIKYKFSSWMPLAIIAGADWTDPKIWRLSDGYGKKGYIPAQGIDWSGIRDSSREAQLEMMNIALESIEKDL